MGVGSGGSVGSPGVLVGTALGGTVGTRVGASVGVGVAGARVAAEPPVVVGEAVGTGVRASDPFAGPPEPIGAFEPTGALEGEPDVAEGLTVGDACDGPSVRPSVSRVRLKAARARATASAGPKRTYRVKEPRPV
jgi:hypothetical protein